METARTSFFKNQFVLYPVYINASRPISGGRKYRKAISVDNPQVQEIRKALETMHVQFTFEAAKKHPRNQETAGRFIINKSAIATISRQMFVSQVTELIKQMREQKSTSKSKGRVANMLKLVPKKKNKTKK